MPSPVAGARAAVEMQRAMVEYNQSLADIPGTPDSSSSYNHIDRTMRQSLPNFTTYGKFPFINQNHTLEVPTPMYEHG